MINRYIILQGQYVCVVSAHYILLILRTSTGIAYCRFRGDIIIRRKRRLLTLVTRTWSAFSAIDTLVFAGQQNSATKVSELPTV